MKRKPIILLVVILLLALPLQAFAAENTVSVQPGITPDSPFYFLDRVVEKVQLALTFNQAKKASVLDMLAEERLAESKSMLEEGKTELAEKALSNYQLILDSASAAIDKAIENGRNITPVMNRIEFSLRTQYTLVQGIVEGFPQGKLESLQKRIEKSMSKIGLSGAAVDMVMDQEQEQVKDQDKEQKQDQSEDCEVPLKQEVTAEVLSGMLSAEDAAAVTAEELNARQILAIKALADYSKKPFGEVLTIFLNNDKGIGATAKALGLDVKDALKEVNTLFKSTKEQIQDKFKEEQDNNKPDTTPKPTPKKNNNNNNNGKGKNND